MKKTLKKFVALLLCFCLLGSTGIVTVFAAAADTDGNDYASVEEYLEQNESSSVKFKRLFTKIINFLSNLLLNGMIGKALNLFTPISRDVQKLDKFNIDEFEGFTPGMREFLSAPAENAVWSLGFAEESIMPADFGEKEYAKGAYLPYVKGDGMYKDDDGESEELRVRVIVMNDGSGRGSVVFAALDAMGIANADVRKIRNAVADFAEENNIVSINVDCTHIHTGIDSQGIWTDPARAIFKNSFTSDTVTGVDPTFLSAIIDGTSKAIKEAYADMKQGRLYYAKTDISDYVWDRTAPINVDEYMYRLEFVPEDETATPTIVCTFGCHPESCSYDWNKKGESGKEFDRLFSPDFVWSMAKLARIAGYNFIYLQGDVNTTTSSRGRSNDGLDTDAHSTAMRLGYEFGYICLTMTMDEEERIAFTEKTGDHLGVAEHSGEPYYTVWYEGRETVSAVEVEPLLNIASKQFVIKIENNLVSTMAKAGMADVFVLRDSLFNYYSVSEVGYMEIGDVLKFYISPGETFAELLMGGSGLDGFPYKCIRDYVGENTVVLDLCNDAGGYIANDANYVMVGLQYNEGSGELDDDTWCLFSYGKHAGSTLLGNYYSLVDECNEHRK